MCLPKFCLLFSIPTTKEAIEISSTILLVVPMVLFLQKAQGRRAGSMRSRGSISGGTAPRVVLYAATNLFPLNRALAERYVINADNPIGESF